MRTVETRPLIVSWFPDWWSPFRSSFCGDAVSGSSNGNLLDSAAGADLLDAGREGASRSGGAVRGGWIRLPRTISGATERAPLCGVAIRLRYQTRRTTDYPGARAAS